MAAETSLLSKYLSTRKHLEYLHASTNKTVYLPQKNSLHYFTNIFVTTILGDIAPLCFIRQVFIFTFQTLLPIPVAAQSKA